jgi:hypothetical protein
VTKILTLAVPVFNQAQAISTSGPALENLFLQNPELISLLVSDNDSTDGTDYAIQKFMPLATKFRQSMNIGFEGNVKSLVFSCETEFIWILGAGDVPLGDIKHVMQSLGESDSKCGIFVSRGEGYEGFSPLISGQIWRVSSLMEVLRSEKPKGDEWPHVAWNLEMRIKGVTVSKISHLEVSIYKDLQDWHETQAMYPFAVALFEVLSKYDPILVGSRDMKIAQQTLGTWFTQDLVNGKVLNRFGRLQDLLRRTPLRFMTGHQVANLVIGLAVPRRLFAWRAERRRGLLHRDVSPKK